MDNVVTKDFCNERSGNMKEAVDRHEGDIRNIQDAIVKLTILVEQHEKKISQGNITSEKVKFWQTKSFEWMIKTGCIILTLLTMAAIGMNYFKEYLGVIK